MKCRKCSSRAVINMRQHKLPLCKPHFTQWVLNQTDRNIHRYKMFSKREKILVAVSGGKDSLALWDVLDKSGYNTTGLHINLGINGEANYSDRSQKFVEKFATQRDLPMIIVDIREQYQWSLPEIAVRSKKYRSKPCAVCGLAKRHILNQTALQNHFDVLVTGHNLDDEVAVLFSNTLNWDLNLLQRQSPVLPSRGGLLKKAKPFCRLYEKETAAYALLESIDYIEEECPFSIGSTTIQHKETLNQIEHNHAGTKLSFYLKFLNAKKDLFVGDNQNLFDSNLTFVCETCGQPTTKPGDCSFCRVMKSLN
jgi:uncharacterized protein (TIGR00269 family)